MPEIDVVAELCTGCGACIALCTGRVYDEAGGLSCAAHPEGCWGCGHCVAACPADAIRHSTYPLEACPPVEAALPSLDQLVAALRERRSARVFQPRAIPREVVRALVDLGRWAPTASNGQPVDWLAFDDPARIAALSAGAVATLAAYARRLRESGADPARAAGLEWLAQRQARGEDPLFFRAPVLLVAHVPEAARRGREDTAYAAYNVMLGAQRQGLGTCQIGYFQAVLEGSAEMRRAIGLPEGRRAEVALVLGYPAYAFHRVLPRRRPELVWNGGG